VVQDDPSIDELDLDDMLALRERLSEVLVRRFERPLALAFSDIVDSTAYFARFGDEAGGALQQRHVDLVRRALDAHGGRIVDTAGDGALVAAASVDACVAALVELEELVAAHNASRAGEHQLRLRCGVHWGPVLTDGTLVTGDAVNLCARVTGSAAAGEIRMTRAAADRLAPRLRARCEPLPATRLRGVARPVELLLLRWREPSRVPTAVRVDETGQRFALPDRPTISVGRLREHAGGAANDIVLELADREQLLKISRWHLELRRESDGLFLHPVSEQSTEVDGRPVGKGQRTPVLPGTRVRLSGVLTLTFLDDDGVVPSPAG
jgi:class 3 adenylate cyclase